MGFVYFIYALLLSLCGYLIVAVANLFGVDSSTGLLDFFRPQCIYKMYKVNWFGATIIVLVNCALCPVGALFTLLHFVCTVGRKRGA